MAVVVDTNVLAYAVNCTCPENELWNCVGLQLRHYGLVNLLRKMEYEFIEP
jgi:hypothetical protein